MSVSVSVNGSLSNLQNTHRWLKLPQKGYVQTRVVGTPVVTLTHQRQVQTYQHGQQEDIVHLPYSDWLQFTCPHTYHNAICSRVVHTILLYSRRLHK
jgi:hypothetical protein